MVSEENGTVYPSMTAFESSSLKVTFNFNKQPGNPQTTLIEAAFENKTSNICTNFIFQVAVPKVMSDHTAFTHYYISIYVYDLFNIIITCNLIP